MPSSKVYFLDCMWYCITFKDRKRVRDTVSRVKNETWCSTRRVKGQHSLDRNIEARNIEGLKHNLSHSLSILLRIKRSLCHEHWMLLRRNSQLVSKHVMPNLFHIFPILNDALINWRLNIEDTSLLHRLFPDINFSRIQSNNWCSLLCWPSNNHRLYTFWQIIPS